MKIIAQATNIRTSPRKLQLAADLIRPLTPEAALITLKHLPKRAAPVLAKTLKQALSNAVNNFKLAKNKLKLRSVEIHAGPVYKRGRAASKGRGHQIKKRTSHIKIILEADEAAPAAAKASVRKSGTKSKS